MPITRGAPGIGVYMAFGNKPTDPGFTFNTDITKSVRTLHYRRGRTAILNQIETGGGDAILNDSDRRFDPNNTASVYYPNVEPLKPIQATAALAGQTYYLMTHFVGRWPRKRIGRNYAERGITTVDGFDLLSLAGVAGKSYSSSLTGAMIASILNDANWPTALRRIAAGASAIAAQTFASSDSTKALPLLQSIVGPGGENGLFFIDGRGYAVFLDRHSQFGPPYNTSQATFTDIVTIPGEFPVTDIVPSSDKDLIYDDWSGTRPSSGTQEAFDPTSILKYGRRSKQITSLLTTDSETLASMQYSLSIYKNPLQRIESITIKPGDYVELWQQCLQREIGDRITVKEHPPGGGQADIRDYIIQSIDAKFEIGPVGKAVYTWGLFPASASAFILDDLVNGVLDTSALGY